MFFCNVLLYQSGKFTDDMEMKEPPKIESFVLFITVSNLGLGPGLGLRLIPCVILIEIGVNQKQPKDGYYIGVLFFKITKTDVTIHFLDASTHL